MDVWKFCMLIFQLASRSKAYLSFQNCPCYGLHAPVCGTDGITYYNVCFLACYNRLQTSFGMFTANTVTTQGWEYVGTASVTKDGLPCSPWADYSGALPRSGEKLEAKHFPEKSIAKVKNYCRNPDRNPIGPWCYTKQREVGYCNVPKCSAGRFSHPGRLGQSVPFDSTFLQPQNHVGQLPFPIPNHAPHEPSLLSHFQPFPFLPQFPSSPTSHLHFGGSTYSSLGSNSFVSFYGNGINGVPTHTFPHFPQTYIVKVAHPGPCHFPFYSNQPSPVREEEQEESLCKDNELYSDYCRRWAKQKRCTRSVSFMKRHCALSCDYCSDD